MSAWDRLWQVNWCLWLIAPGALAFLTVGYTYGWDRIDGKFDSIGPYLAGFALAFYALRIAVTRNPLYIIVGVLAAALLCREIHFDFTDHLVTVLAPAALVWAVIWRKRLAEPLRDWRHTSWLIAAFWSYVFSQFITQRVFKHIRVIPREDVIHSLLEESVETVAHCVFIMAALVGNWRRYGKGAARIPEAPEAPDAVDETAS